jgi:hypothetical protein
VRKGCAWVRGSTRARRTSSGRPGPARATIRV